MRLRGLGPPAARVRARARGLCKRHGGGWRPVGGLGMVALRPCKVAQIGCLVSGLGVSKGGFGEQRVLRRPPARAQTKHEQLKSAIAVAGAVQQRNALWRANKEAKVLPDFLAKKRDNSLDPHGRIGRGRLVCKN